MQALINNISACISRYVNRYCLSELSPLVLGGVAALYLERNRATPLKSREAKPN